MYPETKSDTNDTNAVTSFSQNWSVNKIARVPDVVTAASAIWATL
jgi:hypothetical protein